MSGLEKIKGLFIKAQKAQTGLQDHNPLANHVVDNWFHDRYEWMQVQRNILFVLLVVSMAAVMLLTFGISYIKSNRTIEPYVIEIEPKTGVATVVDPLTAKAYTGMDSVKRYFVWRYINLRENYDPLTYQSDFKAVHLMSTDDVWYTYSRTYGRGNPDAPVNKLGTGGSRSIEMKSMIFQDDTTAQVRFRIYNNSPNGSSTMDKVALVQFRFVNLELNEIDRFTNPLGFQVINYKMDEERIQ